MSNTIFSLKDSFFSNDTTILQPKRISSQLLLKRFFYFQLEYVKSAFEALRSCPEHGSHTANNLNFMTLPNLRAEGTKK